MKLEQNSVKERLLEFIKYRKLSQSKFESMANLSNGYINNMRKSIKPSTFEEKIAPVFPELNKLWLLHGEGNMLVYETLDLTNNEIKKEAPFEKLPIEEKLNKIYIQNQEKIEQDKKIIEQNSTIIEQNSKISKVLNDVKDELDLTSLDSEIAFDLILKKLGIEKKKTKIVPEKNKD